MDHRDQQNFSSDSHFPSESTHDAAQKYQEALKARSYASKISGTGTDRREKKCILEALKLADIPAGSCVLDCPCGPGRLIPLLKKSGFMITGADVSQGMVDEARLYAGPSGQNCLDENDKLCVANLFDTGFKAGQFDAVICHRVFQYFSQPQERILALTELRRISSGPVIVSFLCNWSVDALWRSIMSPLRRAGNKKCKPISPFIFAKEIRSAGFKIKRWIAMRPFLSRRWYAVLEPVQIPCNGLLKSISAYRRIILAAVIRIAACVLAVLMPVLAYSFIVNSDSNRFRQIENLAMQYWDGDETFYITNSSGLKTSELADKNIKLTEITRIDEDIADDEKNDRETLFLLSFKEMKKVQSTPAIAKLEFVGKVKLGTDKFYLLRTPDNDWAYQAKK